MVDPYSLEDFFVILSYVEYTPDVRTEEQNERSSPQLLQSVVNYFDEH